MFDISDQTFCVIGHPIGHTLSPAIHMTVFRSEGVPFRYTAVHVLPEQLPDFIQAARDTGCPGFNVTIPHKETVIPLLDAVDESAKRVGAVNTVKQENGRLKGFNTDVTGLQEALKRGGWTSGELVILIGAGGGARAAVEAMGLMGVKKLVLFDVLAERAERLASDFKGHHSMEIIPGPFRPYLADAGLIINATPVGMWPDTDRSPVDHPEEIQAGTVVFDLVYKPLKTRLMSEAEARGARSISGLGMLISQALAADEIWLGRPMPVALIAEIQNQIHQIKSAD